MNINKMMEKAEKIIKEMKVSTGKQELDRLVDKLDEGARCLKIEEAITEYYRDKIEYSGYDSPIVKPIRLMSICLGDIDQAMNRKSFYSSQLCNDINFECNSNAIPKLREVFVNAESDIIKIANDMESLFKLSPNNITNEANVYGYIYSCILDTGSLKPIYAICDSLKCVTRYGGGLIAYNNRDDFNDSVISICEDLLDILLDLSKQRLYEIENGVEH